MEDKSMGTIECNQLTQDVMKPLIPEKAFQQMHQFALALESRHLNQYDSP